MAAGGCFCRPSGPWSQLSLQVAGPGRPAATQMREPVSVSWGHGNKAGSLGQAEARAHAVGGVPRPEEARGDVTHLPPSAARSLWPRLPLGGYILCE